MSYKTIQLICKFETKTSGKNSQKLSILCHQEILFFVWMCKMGQITKEEYKKCEVEIINMGKYLWVNRKDLEVESDVVN